MKSKERIGIYGGTFDPVHHGHLGLAIEMLEKHALTEIWFCPAVVNPFKQTTQPANRSATQSTLGVADCLATRCARRLYGAYRGPKVIGDDPQSLLVVRHELCGVIDEFAATNTTVSRTSLPVRAAPPKLELPGSPPPRQQCQSVSGCRWHFRKTVWGRSRCPPE